VDNRTLPLLGVAYNARGGSPRVVSTGTGILRTRA